MKCTICGKADMGMMVRTNPIGSDVAGWAHITCLEKSEPELAKNAKVDFGQLEKDIYDGKFKPHLSK